MDQEHPIYQALLPLAVPHRIPDYLRYFQVREGGYGEGDEFLGCSVPNRRLAAKKYGAQWTKQDLVSGLIHPVHEVRHSALFEVITRYAKGKRNGQDEYWMKFLFQNYSGINNWDLVDSCAHKVFGHWARTEEDHSLLEKFLEHPSIWYKRTAVVATLELTKYGEIEWAMRYGLVAASNAPEILQKGVGWVLKEAYQHDPITVLDHLYTYARNGAYTKLIVRTALEKASKATRNELLAQM